jgi:conjugal transfer pilus assembly protein TraU
MNLARPSIRGVHPIGRATATWDAGANPPFMGELGPNDEFLWVVYRRQRCCTCCE